MIYLIDPKDTCKQECWFYCLTKCYNIRVPLYGIPPD